MFLKFLNDETGATAVEYGLIAGLIAIGLVAGATAVGESINTKFTEGAEALDNSPG